MKRLFSPYQNSPFILEQCNPFKSQLFFFYFVLWHFFCFLETIDTLLAISISGTGLRMFLLLREMMIHQDVGEGRDKAGFPVQTLVIPRGREDQVYEKGEERRSYYEERDFCLDVVGGICFFDAQPDVGAGAEAGWSPTGCW